MDRPRRPRAAGLVQGRSYLTASRKAHDSKADQEATAEAARKERRLVIAHNNAWTRRGDSPVLITLV